jgi:transcriptional regulator with XRE-family HTH domain
MIKYNFKTLQEKLSIKYSRKFTLKEICEKSGCDKNAVSRLVNKPTSINPSTKIVDKLIQFFYKELHTMYSGTPQEIMGKISNEFFFIIPDDYLSVIPEHFVNNIFLTTKELWDLYDLYKNKTIGE